MRPSPTLLLLALLFAVPATGRADRLPGLELRREAPDRETPPLRMAQNDGLSLSEAVDQVRRQYNGRIVSAETRVRGNREVHIIRVVTDDGRVKTVTLPGRTRGQH